MNDGTSWLLELLASLSAGWAVVLFGTPNRRPGSICDSPSRRVGDDVNDVIRSGRSPSRTSSVAPRNRTLDYLAAGVAALAAWALLGGIAGFIAAVCVIGVGPALLARLESRDHRTRKQRLTAVAPSIADLLAACMAAGTTIPVALTMVAASVPEPAAGLLRQALALLELGADPKAAWAGLAREPELAPIARAGLRSEASGAPLAEVLLAVGDDLRDRHRSAVEAAAKSVGVRAVGPLGVCFLPAFMLLGVVPLVASLLVGVLP